MQRKSQSSSFRIISVLLGISLMAGLSIGCSDEEPAPAAPSQPGVTTPTSDATQVSIPQGAATMGADAFGTNPLVVSVGATVTWTNTDSVPHTVTADDGSFDSGSLDPGATFSHTFDAAGSFDYHCAIPGHNMQGTVQVR
jgi:plastocyanin